MARILHVLTAPRAEGTPRLVLDWLAVPGHEQGVAFLSGEPADLAADFQKSACWMATAETLSNGPGKFPAIVRTSRTWVREFQPDLVIAWPMGFSHWIFLGARLAGSRAALLSHAGNPPGTGWYARYALTWVCLGLTAACNARVVACSRYVQSRFQAIALVPRRRIGFAYNSVRASQVTERAAAARRRRPVGDRRRIIMVATLEAHKDHDTLLRAAALLRETGDRQEILLVGAGHLDSVLRRRAQELNLGDTVVFAGARNDVPELLGISDLFVFATTEREGRPGAVLEALAAGLPVVASDVSPLRELLEDGRWGRLVRPGDPAALAEAIRESAAILPENARAASSFACGFTPERMIESYFLEAGLPPPSTDSAALATPSPVLST